jgi:hypothetical protein
MQSFHPPKEIGFQREWKKLFFKKRNGFSYLKIST